MLRRPKPTDDEDELVRQYQEFQAQLNKHGGKLLNSKRKNDNEDNNESELKHTTKVKSRFAENLQSSKKKKEGALDNTILEEAVLQGGAKAAVLGPIVPRNVPLLLPPQSLWKPSPMPGGFPKPFKLSNLNDINKNSNGVRPKKRSLYMQKLEQEGLMRENPLTSDVSSTTPIEETTSLADDKLADLGKFSYILDGHSGLGDPNEAKKIHQENLSRLSGMSHEQRIKERNEIMNALAPEQLEFIKSLRHRAPLPPTQRAPLPVSETQAQRDAPEMEIQEDEGKERPPSRGGISEHESSETAKKKVSFEEGVRLMEVEEEEAAKGPPALPSEDGLPIPPSVAQHWPNMNKIEMDKMQWMTEVPAPKPLKNNEGFTARFNFEGDLLPYEADISWREGLHHHGQEPGRAGYSLDELFIFVRSQVVQQRHIGLKVLANILRNAQEGLYDGCFESSIIQSVVDAGAVILIRFALDESTPLVFQEALRALYFLVSSEPDEHCLSLAEPLTPLGVQPGVSSSANTKEKDKKELDSEEKELKDTEILQLDIIRALIRMDIFNRIRYLLEGSIELSPPDVIHSLGILTRIARHSLSSSWTLLQTPRLLSLIIEKFLPHNVNPLLTGQSVSKMRTVYGVPLWHALSLLKVLSARGRQIASHLVDSFNIMSRLLTYVSIEPNEFGLPLQETLTLSREAYALWSKLLAYGLMKPQESMLSFVPLLIKQLMFYKDKVDINRDLEENKFNYDLGSHILDLMTKGIFVSATQPLLLHRLKKNEPSIKTADDKPGVLLPPILEYRHFDELQSLVEICFTKWMRQLTLEGNSSYQGLKLVGSACAFISAYFSKWKDDRSYDSHKSLNRIANLYTNVLMPFLSSDFFLLLLKRISAHSSLVSKLKPSERQPHNLDSLASVTFKGKVVPVIQPDSPFPFLLPLTSLLLDFVLQNPDLPSEPIRSLLDSKYLTTYMESICASSSSLANQWFSRIEISNLSNLLLLASLKECSHPLLFHQMALRILPLVQKGDEHLIPQLITNVICNPYFTSDISDVEIQMNSLSFDEYKPLSSPAISQPTLSSKQLTERLLISLPMIALDYKNCIVDKGQLNKSSILASLIPFLVNSLTIDVSKSTPLDHYWCLTPLKQLTDCSKTRSEELASEQSSPDLILSVLRWLQMAYLLLKYRRKRILESTPKSITSWFRTLSLVFITSNDLFLDVQISSYLQACLLELMKERGFALLDVSLTVNNVSSYDWYKIMLEQYGSVSYGDSTFALFVSIPLQRHWPTSYKLLLFGEHSDALSFIRLSREDVEQFIPFSQFCEPCEDNADVLLAYRSAIHSRSINKIRNPFLFDFVSHHLSQKK